MTIDECVKMLIAKIECMKRETSGIDTDCNAQKCDDCSLCYEQGTIGKQKEALMYAVDIMRKYLMMQVDYENRLKEDMVAMLTEIQMEIEELPMYYDPLDISDLIQQKINSLKEKS